MTIYDSGNLTGEDITNKINAAIAEGSDTINLFNCHMEGEGEAAVPVAHVIYYNSQEL